MVKIKPKKDPKAASTLKKTVKKSVVTEEEMLVRAAEAVADETEVEKVLPETVKTKKIMDYAEGSVEGDEYLVLQGEKEAKRVSVETLLNSDGDASKIVINGVEYAADEEGKVVVPDTFATQDFVYEEIAKAQLADEEVDLSGYAKKSELEGLASKEEVEAAIAGIEHPVYDDSELRQMIEAIEVPSVEGLASEEFVREQIEAIEMPEPYDDTELREMIAAIEVPSVEGLASEEFVREEVAKLVDAAPEAMDTLKELAGAIVEHQDIYDAFVAQQAAALEAKADKEEVQGLHERLDAEIANLHGMVQSEVERMNYVVSEESARAMAREDEIEAKIDAIEIPEVPSIEGLASEEFVREQIAAIEIPEMPEVPSIDHLATKEEVESKHQEVIEAMEAEHQAIRDEIEAKQQEIHSRMDGEHGQIRYEMDVKHAELQAEMQQRDEDIFARSLAEIYAKHTELQAEMKQGDEEVFAKSLAEMDVKIADLVNAAPEAMDTLKELADAIEGHQDVYDAYVAQQAEVLAAKVDKVEGKSLVDDAEIARLAEVHNYDDAEIREMIAAIEVPSVEGLATEDFVKEQIDAIEHPVFDDAHLASKEELAEVKAALEEEVARAKAREDEIAAEIDDEEPYMADLAAYKTSKFLFACGHPVYVEGQEDGSVVVSFKAMGENKEIVLPAEDAAKTYIVGGYGHDNHNSKRSLPMTKVVAKNAKIKGIVGGHYFEGIVGHAHIEAENCQMVSVIAGGWCGANVDGRKTRLNIVHEAECKLTNCTVSSTFFGGSQGNGTVDESHVVLDGVKAGWVTVGGSNGLTNGGHLEVKGESDIKVLQTVNRGLVRKAVVYVHEGHVEQLFVGGETEDKTVDGVVKEVELNLMGGVIDKLRVGTSEGQPFAGQLVGSMRQPEVKESEVDLGLFKVIEDEVLPEYALKDHTHEGMATEAFVREEIAKAQLEESEVDLSAYATKAEVEAAIAGIEHPVYDDSELRQMIEAIEIPEVPSVEGLASEEYVQQQIAGIEHPQYDDSELRGMIEAIEVPSVEGLASEEFVMEQIGALIDSAPDAMNTLNELAEAIADHQDVYDGFVETVATKTELAEAIAGIEHPQYDDSELRQMIEAIEVPSVEGLASEEYVKAQIEGIEHPVYDDSELRQMIEAIEIPEVPSVEGLASEEFVQEQIAAIEHPQYDDSELRGMIEAIEVPSVEGLASEQFVKDEIAKIEIPEMPEVPSIEGLASEEFVEQKIAEIEHPTFDDSHLATKEEIEGKVDAVEGKSLVANDEIARLAEVFNANYQFRINMLPAGQEAYVNMTGQYPDIVVTFNIPMGSVVAPEEPEEPTGKPRMWYGWIPYDENGVSGFCTPEEIHEGMDMTVINFGLNNGTLIEAEPGVISYDIVNAPDYSWICIVLPIDSGLKGYVDDGIGNKIKFTEMDTESGLSVDELVITNPIDSVQYKVSGLYVYTNGMNTKIYVE